MKMRRMVLLFVACVLVVVWFVPRAEAGDAKKVDAAKVEAAKVEATKTGSASYQVPYRLTDTQHIMVRAKINGKGPFNFIVDTGAPLIFVNTSVGKKIGLSADKKGWTTVDRFELEGGIVQSKVKCRVETPFQLEGMNGMGLAGVELHGILGYTALAPYKMEIDFTRDKMTWTELAFQPPAPQPVGGKGGQGGLEMIGGLMKFLGVISGIKGPPEQVPRGFVGIELADAGPGVRVKSVIAGGPAEHAGLKAGDRIEKAQGRLLKTPAELHRLAAALTSGKKLDLTVTRSSPDQIIYQAGRGLFHRRLRAVIVPGPASRHDVTVTTGEGL